MGKLKKSFILIFVSLLVFMQLVPVNVFAASKKTMYVISSYTKKYKSGYWTSGEFFYKNGLLVKSVAGDVRSEENYSYNKKGNITSFTVSNPYKKNHYRLTLNSKGKAKRDPINNNSLLYNKKGMLIGVNASDYSYKFTYNKKKQLVKTETIRDGVVSSKVSFTYDKKGNKKTITDYYSKKAQKTLFKNTYKNGRLVKVVRGTSTTTFEYKKVKVPKKYVAKVKAQQNWIRNGGPGALYTA